MQLAGQNSEDFFQGILIGTLFQKSENLVQILRNFFENFIDRTKPRFPQNIQLLTCNVLNMLPVKIGVSKQDKQTSVCISLTIGAHGF